MPGKAAAEVTFPEKSKAVSYTISINLADVVNVLFDSSLMDSAEKNVMFLMFRLLYKKVSWKLRTAYDDYVLHVSFCLGRGLLAQPGILFALWYLA